MRFEQLPRDENGAVTGSWKLRHRAVDYSDQVGGVVFVNGVTREPVDGYTTARLLVGMGDCIEAEPWTLPECGTPTTWSHLVAMSESDLRDMGKELGFTDKRWKAPKLRSVIAEELGIDSDEESDGD